MTQDRLNNLANLLHFISKDKPEKEKKKQAPALDLTENEKPKLFYKLNGLLF